jgi:uncharacterized protein (DUF736 family)
MPAIGYVTKQKDGSYLGELKTLTIQAPLEIRPNPSAGLESGADFRVFVQNVEVGEGWTRISVGTENKYVAVTLATPEFGAKRILANLGRAAGQGDDRVFAVIWNPID